MSTALSGRNGCIRLTAYVFGEMTQQRINDIKNYLNTTIAKVDPENQLANFQVAQENVLEMQNNPMVSYAFYSTGPGADSRNMLTFFNKSHC